MTSSTKRTVPASRKLVVPDARYQSFIVSTCEVPTRKLSRFGAAMSASP